MNTENKMDQASTLRKITNADRKVDDRNYTPFTRECKTAARVIAVTSGKGGVGKTNVVANLAFLFSQMDLKTLVLDADMALANIDILLGLTPKYNLQHVICGEKQIAEIIIKGPGGMAILPASSGVQELSELTYEQKLCLLSELGRLNKTVDILLIDTGAGISSNVMYFTMAAQEKIIVVSPEATSITDAYAVMKVMAKKYDEKCFKMIVNSVKNAGEAQEVYRNLSLVTERFLDVSIDCLGWIAQDEHIAKAVKQQKPVTQIYPQAEASRCFLKLAKKILTNKPILSPGGNIGFFWEQLLEST